MHHLKLYLRFIIIYLKSKMEYRFSFFMDIFIQILTYIISYTSIWIVLNKFNIIQGWTFYEVMFLYNLNLFSYGISGLFFWSPMRELEGMVQQGTFDSILIRPINPFLHIVCRQFNHAFIGHIILGSIVFTICLQKLQIQWDLMNIALFGMTIIGAVLIQAAMLIITGSLSFWFVKSTAFVDTTIYGLRNFLNYPLSIYDKWVEVLLTFVIPYGFVNFYPAQYFLDKKDDIIFHPSFKYGTPVVGIIIFTLSMLVWKAGIGKYQSTGS